MTIVDTPVIYFSFRLVFGFSFLLSVAFCAVVRVALAHLADVYACGQILLFSPCLMQQKRSLI